MGNQDYLHSLIIELTKLPRECEWVEFKKNNAQEEDIGSYISALSNSATLAEKETAYLVWGVDDATHEIVGTTFDPDTKKIGNEELENWLLQRLNPRIYFQFHKLTLQEKSVVLLEIPAATKQPTSFHNEEKIRIGSYKKNLRDFPEKERILWNLVNKTTFETMPAYEHIEKQKILELLDYSAYFDMLQQPIPDGHTATIEALVNDNLVIKNDGGTYTITNLGAVLFAKNLNSFSGLVRKSVRVIQYETESRIKTIREDVMHKGYAIGFSELIKIIMTLVPSREDLSTPLRKTFTMFPEIAVRELVANALIHQDFLQTGTSVMIEIFPTRIEITNPGKPLVRIDRFLDSPPKSRNEKLASMMRRLEICEERGSGIDKVIHEIEIAQMPAPLFETLEDFTRVVLFSYRTLKNLTIEDRIRACYFHASLKYSQREYMTNASLRERLGISPKNGSMITRIINASLEAHKISVFDETVGTKARKYIPWWAKQ